MRRRKSGKHTHLLEATAIAGGIMILVLIALGIKATGPALTAAVVQAQVLAFTNVERAQHNVGVLAESSVLDAAAQAKANDMAAKGYFSHTGPDGLPPWHWFVEAGYDYHYAGENLAVRFTDSKEVVDAWMASPTHRDNIVKESYTEIGIGVADGMYQGQPATFVVQFFGSPKTAIAAKPQAPSTLVVKTPAAQRTVAKAVPVVAGAETSASVASPTHMSFILRIANFFSTALRSLTASTVESDSVTIGEEGASTER